MKTHRLVHVNSGVEVFEVSNRYYVTERAGKFDVICEKCALKYSKDCNVDICNGNSFLVEIPSELVLREKIKYPFRSDFE